MSIRVDLPLLQRSPSIQLALAPVPLALVFLSFLSSWGWRAAGWPLAVGLPPPYLAILGLVVLGALEGLRRGTPPWAYSWLAQTLHGLGPLVGSFVAFTLFPDAEGVVTGEQQVYVWTNLGINQFWVFLALVGALLLARRSPQDALFFFTLFLGAKLVTFPIQSAPFSGISPHAVNGALAVLAAAEGVAMAALLYRFLTGDPHSWRPFWALCGLVLLDPLLKLWPVLLQTGAITEYLKSFGQLLALAWFLDVGFLAVAFASLRVSLARRRRLV